MNVRLEESYKNAKNRQGEMMNDEIYHRRPFYILFTCSALSSLPSLVGGASGTDRSRRNHRRDVSGRAAEGRTALPETAKRILRKAGP